MVMKQNKTKKIISDIKICLENVGLSIADDFFGLILIVITPLFIYS